MPTASLTTKITTNKKISRADLQEALSSLIDQNKLRDDLTTFLKQFDFVDDDYINKVLRDIHSYAI